MSVFRRRKISFPNLLSSRQMFGSSIPCEACKLLAIYCLTYEVDEHSPVSEIFVCTIHENMVRRRQWKQLFADQNKKISEGEL